MEVSHRSSTLKNQSESGREESASRPSDQSELLYGLVDRFAFGQSSLAGVRCVLRGARDAVARRFPEGIAVDDGLGARQFGIERRPPLRSARSDSKGYSEVRRDGGAGGWIDTVMRRARSGYFIE
jgi:hypothetical protein